MRRGTRVDQSLRSESSLDPEDYMPWLPLASTAHIARVAIEAYVRATEMHPPHAPEEAMLVARQAARDAADDVDVAGELSGAVVLAYRRSLAALPLEPEDPDLTNEERAVELAIEDVDEADRDWLGRGRYG